MPDQLYSAGAASNGAFSGMSAPRTALKGATTSADNATRSVLIGSPHTLLTSPTIAEPLSQCAPFLQQLHRKAPSTARPMLRAGVSRPAEAGSAWRLYSA